MNDYDETLVLLSVYSADTEINYVSGSNSINVKVTLDSEIVPMQLHTGVLSPLSQKAPPVKIPTTNITVKSYTSDATSIARKAYIPVTYGEQLFTLQVVMACGERPAVLDGRD